MRLAAQGQEVAADVGVGVLDRVLDLIHRHANIGGDLLTLGSQTRIDLAMPSTS